MRKHPYKCFSIIVALSILFFCLPPLSFAAEQTKSIFPGTLSLETKKGPVRTAVKFQVHGLTPNQGTELYWQTVDGSYDIEGIYKFIGSSFVDKEVKLGSGKSDRTGNWNGEFNIPEDFGGNHTLYVKQAGIIKAQANFFVETTFSISPASGPIGTEITISAEGIGWKEMESNWQLTYDNKITGLISAVSTKGKATASIRAAGPAGLHTITIWHGYLGLPYINHQQAPTAYLPVPHFNFEVTDEKPEVKNTVEPAPRSGAGGGVKMPSLQNNPGVMVQLSKESGIVGEQVTLTAKGLPANQTIDLNWVTMVGNRVTDAGFKEQMNVFGQAKADTNGKLSHTFAIPNDLGGIPHRIDLTIKDKKYGQAYLRILPSIVKVTPASAPAGTEISVEIQGVGWTEFDNSYHITYDNAYLGYVCGFNSQGTVKFTLISSGEPGIHLIDLYPGIYKGEKLKPDIYNAPQLTYKEDHPGSAIPAIRLHVEVTE